VKPADAKVLSAEPAEAQRRPHWQGVQHRRNMRDFARVVLDVQRRYGLSRYGIEGQEDGAAHLALRLAVDSGLWDDWGRPEIDDQRDLEAAIAEIERGRRRARSGRPPSAEWSKTEDLGRIALYFQSHGARPQQAVRLAEHATGVYAGSEAKVRSAVGGLRSELSNGKNFVLLVQAAYASLTGHRRGTKLPNLRGILRRQGAGAGPGRPRKSKRTAGGV
jgi:hypothetical protein